MRAVIFPADSYILFWQTAHWLLNPVGDFLHRARTARTAEHVGTNYGEKVIAWFLGYSMLTHCPHSEAEMTAAGTLSPFDRV